MVQENIPQNSPQETQSFVSTQEASLNHETIPQTGPQQAKSVVSAQEASLAQENIAQGSPETSPQQSQSILSPQEAFLTQENIDLISTEEIPLGSHEHAEEKEPCANEELETQDNNMDLKSSHMLEPETQDNNMDLRSLETQMDLKSSHTLFSSGVESGFSSPSPPSSEVHEQRKPSSETSMLHSSDEVFAEQFRQNIDAHAFSEPKRPTSPVPCCSKDVTAGLDLEKLLDFEAEERRKQEEEDALLAKQLQEESDLETRPFLFSDRRENTPTRPKTTFHKQSSLPSLSGKLKICGGRHRTLGCKRCKGCLATNCGKCANCRDMPRYGGRGTGKQRCIWRRCVAPMPGSCPACKRTSM